MLRERCVRLMRKSGQREDDLDEEIQGHLRMAERDRIDRGQDPTQARFAALREFGNLDMVRETARGAWGWLWLERLMQDLRYGLRMIHRNRAFSAAVVITLALVIGANISVFHILNAVDLRPLPVHNPEELVQLQGLQNGAPTPLFSHLLYQAIDSNQKAAEGVFASAYMNAYYVAINGRSPIDRVEARLTTGDYFPTLGVQAQIGRTTTEADDQPYATPTAVISDRFWRKEFGARTDAIGDAITINRRLFYVVGVAPRTFFGEIVGSSPDVWIPINAAPASERGVGLQLLEPLARLRPGVSMEEAQAEFSFLCNQMLNKNQHRSSVNDFRVELKPLGRGKNRMTEFLTPLWLLMAIAGFIMLVACCNLAGLFLARTAARAPEIGVRSALGAPRIRLVRQLLTESLLIASLGGVLGLIFGIWGSGGLIALAAPGDVLRVSTGMDWRVVAFALSLILATAFLFGLAPALSISRAHLSAALRTNRKSSTAGSGRHAAKAFIVAQLSVSLVLIAGASLLVRSFWNIFHQDWGYRRDRVLVMDLAFDPQTLAISMSPAFRETLQQRLSSLPGVVSATFSSEWPLGDVVAGGEIAAPNRPQKSDRAQFIQVSSHYFETMDIPIVAGRPITEHDVMGRQPVAVITQTAARKLFGAANPVGRYFAAKSMGARSLIEIVGVAHDVRYRPRDPFGSLVFWPIGQADYMNPSPSWFIRAEGDPAALTKTIRSAVQEVDPRMRVANIVPWRQVLLSSIRHERMLAWTAGGLGVLALVLACVGLYGVISFGVQRRTQEIGIRLALASLEAKCAGLCCGKQGCCLWQGLRSGALAHSC